MSGSSEFHNALSRRDFLRTTSVALGAAAVGVGLGTARAAGPLTVNNLPAIQLGRTGLKVTRISFGGILTTEPSVLQHVIDQGINCIHTSSGYTNGRSYEAFGKVLKTERKKVVLAIKDGPENMDKWLQTLNTDHADVILPPITSAAQLENPALREEFEKQKKAGKVGHLGFACHSNMTEVLNRARELGYFEVVLLGYSKSTDPAFLEATKKATAAGMGILSMKGLPKHLSQDISDEEKAQFTARVNAMLFEQNAHSVLASMGSFQAVDFFRDLMQTKLGYLDRGAEQRYWAAQEGRYCAMCGNCSGVCPRGVEVSNVVRYRMYDQDYGLSGYARGQYAALSCPVDPAACADCNLCEKVCTRRLPLRRMLAEAHSAFA
jgi:predicted aldo/keto reductase-like oxidoreductase